MESRPCPACRKPVQAGLLGMRLECGHWVHTGCMDKQNPDFDQCMACRGDVDLTASEPLSYEGHDYVETPVDRSPYWFSGRSKAEPFTWLREQKPLKWIIEEKQYGLQRLLHAGVSIDDFLNNGYRWSDLKAFRDMSTRGKDALFALGTNAEHFRGSLGVEPVKELGITGKDLVELFGFVFPETAQPLEVVGGKNDRPWKASELVELGMKMVDLEGAGLEYVEQLNHLEPSAADKRALGITQTDVAPQELVVRVITEPKPAPRIVSRQLHGLRKK